ncbi:MAG: hypothetical protein OEZ01_09335, partial [Candidatus Heimdallarchaeota archaeon]|nr:hypothetical protein [Candidatus Heimdallarchaeota archaeon]
MPEESSVELIVYEAFKSDITREDISTLGKIPILPEGIVQWSHFTLSIARIPNEIFKQLSINEGDIIEIKGQRSTGAIAFGHLSKDDPNNIIRIDALLRKNAGINLKDRVIINKVNIKEATIIELLPPSNIIIDYDGLEKFVRKGLFGYPMTIGDEIKLPILGVLKTFEIQGTKPDGIVRVNENTHIYISTINKSLRPINDTNTIITQSQLYYLNMLVQETNTTKLLLTRSEAIVLFNMGDSSEEEMPSIDARFTLDLAKGYAIGEINNQIFVLPKNRILKKDEPYFNKYILDNDIQEISLCEIILKQIVDTFGIKWIITALADILSQKYEYLSHGQAIAMIKRILGGKLNSTERSLLYRIRQKIDNFKLLVYDLEKFVQKESIELIPEFDPIHNLVMYRGEKKNLFSENKDLKLICHNCGFFLDISEEPKEILYPEHCGLPLFIEDKVLSKDLLALIQKQKNISTQKEHEQKLHSNLQLRCVICMEVFEKETLEKYTDGESLP